MIIAVNRIDYIKKNHLAKVDNIVTVKIKATLKWSRENSSSEWITHERDLHMNVFKHLFQNYLHLVKTEMLDIFSPEARK